MPKEMLVTLWSIEYSEKNRIKKLILKISFNFLLNRRIRYFTRVFTIKLRAILFQNNISTFRSKRHPHRDEYRHIYGSLL